MIDGRKGLFFIKFHVINSFYNSYIVQIVSLNFLFENYCNRTLDTRVSEIALGKRVDAYACRVQFAKQRSKLN